ncbi:hypothetical protein BaRGS_00000066 [Batillaria attramentaria]|uniref:Protein regulator of cytokinesis 1 n=1 Tax=Batillaria attramentaria TaxID=370345 RepID=A0ABD0MAU4_9CAEN
MTSFSNSRKHTREEVMRKLDVSLDKLYRIWHEIGIDEIQVSNRAGTVSMHLCNLLEEMVSEEEQLRDQMAMNIQRHVDELSNLCLELAVPVPKVTENMSMVQREKELRLKLETLTREKQDRLQTLKRLREKDQTLCDILCITPYYVPSSVTPTRDQLHELEAHVKSLEAEKEKRHGEFVSTKEKIVALCNEMDYDPETSFERDLICEDDDAFQLSAENMESLKNLHRELDRKNKELVHTVDDLWIRVRSLWDRLELEEAERKDFESRHQGHKHSVVSALQGELIRCEHLKYANLQRFVEATRRELIDWWGRCYFSKEQRDNFLPFCDENYTEELLEVHEQELQKMRDYYEQHREVLSLLEKREKLWSEMLEFEKKASDPNRFFNDRGGKLLREEKARKKLEKDLPRVEDEAKELIEEWEKETGKKFLVEGVPFPDYVQRQWETFRREKEQEKQNRQKTKAKQMEEEMIFGSKPTTNTPAKRRFQNTPGRTPLKARKLNETPRTPASVSRIQHSSVFQSPYGRQPLSAKTPNMNHTQRRRSLRQARKVLQESMQRNSASKKGAGKNGATELFSQTTVSSGASIGNVSIATMGSYQDFAEKLKTSTSSTPGNSTTLSLKSAASGYDGPYVVDSVPTHSEKMCNGYICVCLQKGLSQTSRPNCRSSVAPAPAINTSPIKRW